MHIPYRTYTANIFPLSTSSTRGRGGVWRASEQEEGYAYGLYNKTGGGKCQFWIAKLTQPSIAFPQSPSPFELQNSSTALLTPKS